MPLLKSLTRLFRAKPTVAVLPLSGVIGAFGPRRRGLSLAGLAPSIERAFKTSNLKAVALAINSPGGSPVQSSLIQRRIRALAAEKKVPVFAFTEDVAASGGYWLLLAGDEVYADENSIVGSIGVVSAGFGFPEALRKLGIERRVHTAGGRKSFHDPFQEEKAEDVARLRALQDEIHENFRAFVRERRAGKLKAPEDELFSGEFWAGRRALALGLIDGLGDLRTVMRERYGKAVRFRVFGQQRSLLGSLLRGRQEWPEHALSALDERLWWSRYGL
jgi:serine protease SohB